MSEIYEKAFYLTEAYAQTVIIQSCGFENQSSKVKFCMYSKSPLS
jgi:hypothetical protein